MKKLRTQMRWIMLLIAVAFLLSTFLMYEGRSRGPRRGSDGHVEDYEVAEVNGRPLMRSELERRVRNYFEQLQQRDTASVDLPALYQAALEQYATELQLAQEVKERGISVSEAEAERAMKEYADQAFPTREAFYQSLERSGVSVADYKKNIARQLANEHLLRSVVGSVALSEDEAVKFYDAMKGLLYRQPSGVKLQLASFAASADAEALRERLLKGMNWAQATSGDVLSSQDVRNVTTEALFLPDSAFDSGALASLKDLKVEEVSPVFEISSDDFAVGLKTETIEEQTIPYEEVSSDIRVLLRQQKERELITRFDEELLQKARIVIHDASLFPKPASEGSGDVPAPSPEAASGDEAAKPAKVEGKTEGDKVPGAENVSSDAASEDKK